MKIELQALKQESKELVAYLDQMSRSVVPAFHEKHRAQALNVIKLWKVIDAYQAAIEESKCVSAFQLFGGDKHHDSYGDWIETRAAELLASYLDSSSGAHDEG